MNFKCSVCNSVYSKFRRWCKNCGQQDSIIEDKLDYNNFTVPVIHDIKHIEELIRYTSGSKEFDNVCGGGIVPGSALLLGGEPGMGKSTILSQLCHFLENIAIYCSGEENISQIQLRCQRLNLSNVKAVASNNLESILALIEKIKPSLIVIDSIQTLRSNENLDIKEMTDKVICLCKSLNCSVIFVGHVIKSGELAGPKMLEHLVDVVLTLEGENDTRILRSIKNRFGSTDEIGIFKMTENGIIECNNTTKLFDSYLEPVIGSCVFIAFQGSRAFALEIQALVNDSFLQMPRRSVVGLCYNRLAMILAVLEKYTNLRFANKDIYLNVLSGFKVQDLAAADLPIAIALISSILKKPICPNLAAFGEISLIGNIRTAIHLNDRVKLTEKYQLELFDVQHVKNIISLL